MSQCLHRVVVWPIERDGNRVTQQHVESTCILTTAQRRVPAGLERIATNRFSAHAGGHCRSCANSG